MIANTSSYSFVRNLGGTLGLAIAGTIMYVLPNFQSSRSKTTNSSSNNLISSSISSLGLTSEETRSFLASPTNYLSKLPADEAEHARSLIIPAYRKGFRIIFIIGAALSALAFVLAVVLMPQVTLNRDDDKKLKEEGKQRIKAEKEKGNRDEENTSR